jgi:very-short-patch-repair endonuclease
VQRGLARSPGLTKVVRPDSVGRRLNVSFYCPRMLLIVEIEMVWRRSETELGRGLARSPGLTKVVRPDSVGRRLNVSFYCPRMLLIVEARWSGGARKPSWGGAWLAVLV